MSTALEHAIESAVPQPPMPTGKVRLSYLDGVRALAQSGVVAHHIYLRVRESVVTAGDKHHWPMFLWPGHCVVGIFVVLSGYSLMIPVAKSADHRLTGGLGRYFYRRAWRILPPYYAGIFFSILPLLPRWIGWPRLPWASAGPVLITAPSLLAHLLLIQNFKPQWAVTINGPLWSIATEWQLYFVFALMLLPVWRRWGSVALLGFAVVMSAILIAILGVFVQCSPWYVVLFAMGMSGSAINFNRDQKPGLAAKFPWGTLAGITLALLTAWLVFGLECPLLTDALTGITVTATMVAATKRRLNHQLHRDPLEGLLRLLESKPMTTLGHASYSVYLTHGPLINVIATVLAVAGVTAYKQIWVLPIVSIPLILIWAIVFHWMFERPIIQRQREK